MPSTLSDAARELESGRADPVALAEQALAAAKDAGAAFILLTEERALFEAGQARERRRRGLPLSRWDGVPISWKDLFDLKGTRTTAASRTRADVAPASADAPLVRQGARAGLVAIGKTNLSEFAFSGLGANAHFGTPRGPVGQDGLARVPGGSSSGAATAVVAGAGFVGIGSDTAGSVRIPAALQGIVGYRPSMGRYSLEGVFPLAPSFDTPGPLARSVEDCAAIDAIFCGELDQNLEPSRLGDAVLVVDRPLLDAPNVEPAVRANLVRFVENLERHGARIRYGEVAALRDAFATIDKVGWLGGIEALAFHREVLASDRRGLIDPRIVTRLERARGIAPDIVADLYARRTILVKAIAEELDGATLVFPTVPHVAPLLDPLLGDDELFARTNLATLRSTMATAYLAMPGLALPSGTDDNGVPTSVCLSAPARGDRNLLRLGLAVERASR
jgi:aspartyl-tRNA(Asn)/glutamyl-tRNA(Gln) amidotransferase subunit A